MKPSTLSMLKAIHALKKAQLQPVINESARTKNPFLTQNPALSTITHMHLLFSTGTSATGETIFYSLRACVMKSNEWERRGALLHHQPKKV